jgi:hypothetical protein
MAGRRADRHLPAVDDATRAAQEGFGGVMVWEGVCGGKLGGSKRRTGLFRAREVFRCHTQGHFHIIGINEHVVEQYANEHQLH